MSRRRNASLVLYALPVAAGLTAATAAALAASPHRGAETVVPIATAAYKNAISRTANMVADDTAQKMAQRHGLNILNLTWEDTGRYKNSSVGANISDMTIQVATRDPRSSATSVTCMPVIRYPNFSDKTCDLDPKDFTLLIGNQSRDANAPLRRVSLYDILSNPTAYMTGPDQWRGPAKSLLAPARDSKVLVSAQACFLPIPKQGKATFNPVVFNYQSYTGNPAVLTILATREGSSITAIDNSRDAFDGGSVWGQRLFHNLHGMRTSLTGTRESDFKMPASVSSNPNPDPRTPGTRQPVEGLNMVLLIQIPLKQKPQPRRTLSIAYEATDAAPAAAKVASRASNVENAVIGHGASEGKFTETDRLPVERDPRFPVRVTVQFYKATDNGIVSAADLNQIKSQIDRIYNRSTNIGSLVTGGATGRITEYDGPKVEPPDWWDNFWTLREHETHIPRTEQIRRLRNLLGDNYESHPVTELYLRDLLRAGA